MKELQIRLKDLTTIGVSDDRLLSGTCDDLVKEWELGGTLRFKFLSTDGKHTLDYILPNENIQYMVYVTEVE